MVSTRLGSSLVWMMLACGCSDSPEEQCSDLLAAVCTRVTMCTEELTDTMAPEGFESECVKRVEQSTGVCENAVDVASSYDTCMDEIEGGSCDDLLTIRPSDDKLTVILPTSCKGVIKVDSRQPIDSPEPRVAGGL
ncbi:MAG TPA: hypothetical protein VJV78_26770 [Polyangiales bacterium]|nr:hypothetical protein [Polyangiales bacterium]